MKTKDEKFYELVKPLIKNCFEVVKNKEAEQNFYFPTFKKWFIPEISSAGVSYMKEIKPPKLWDYLGEAKPIPLPSKYSSVLNVSSYSFEEDFESTLGFIYEKRIEEFDSYKTLLSYCLENEEIKNHINGNRSSNTNEERLKFHLSQMIKRITSFLIESVIKDTNKTEFNDESFNKFFNVISNTIFGAFHSVDLLIPIPFMKFSCDEYAFSDCFLIQKMSEELQISRMFAYDSSDFAFPVHKNITSSATHAFVIKSAMKDKLNDYYSQAFQTDFDIIYRELFKSMFLYVIENLFITLQLVSKNEVGFTQIIALKDNWGLERIAYLPSLSCINVKEYPDTWEDEKWQKRKEPPIEVNEEQLNAVKEIFLKLNSLNDKNKGHKRIILSKKRFLTSNLKNQDNDSIIDIAIGLEALFTDDQKTEIAYRLANRIASVYKSLDYKIKDPNVLYDLAKRIYKCRSDLVHGTQPQDFVCLSDARELLGSVLKYFLQNFQEYKFDEILNKMDRDLITNLKND